jgi:ABC-type nitrate/sulfonate/bicarbonate transport system ATPase subunit
MSIIICKKNTRQQIVDPVRKPSSAEKGTPSLTHREREYPRVSQQDILFSGAWRTALANVNFTQHNQSRSRLCTHLTSGQKRVLREFSGLY